MCHKNSALLLAAGRRVLNVLEVTIEKRGDKEVNLWQEGKRGEKCSCAKIKFDLQLIKGSLFKEKEKKGLHAEEAFQNSSFI